MYIYNFYCLLQNHINVVSTWYSLVSWKFKFFWMPRDDHIFPPVDRQVLAF